MDKSLSIRNKKLKPKQVDLDTGMPDLPKKSYLRLHLLSRNKHGFSHCKVLRWSRICQTIGANPNNLGFFFIFPPLMGMIVQPIMGEDVRSNLESLWSSVALPIIWDTDCDISFDHVTILRFPWFRLWVQWLR